MHLGIQALKRKAGVLVIQGNEMPTFPDFPIYRVTQKYASLKSARGHSYKACELALSSSPRTAFRWRGRSRTLSG